MSTSYDLKRRSVQITHGIRDQWLVEYLSVAGWMPDMLHSDALQRHGDGVFSDFDTASHAALTWMKDGTLNKGFYI
jgi:hypothetical protein